MAKHVCVVFTSPVPGQEDTYNAWYSAQHLAWVYDPIPPAVAAQR